MKTVTGMLQKYGWYSMLVVVLLASGCKEEDFCAIPQFDVNKARLNSDIEEIDDFIISGGLTALVHKTGIRYIINEPGNSNEPDNCSLIRISYEGSLLDGSVFDKTDPGKTRDFFLEQLIPGWQIMLPEIGEGGSITMFLPSGYGYGASSPSPSIPANSILIFTIDLVEVYN